MDRWVGKICVITGASSGIGAACAKDLAASGLIVIGLARRVDLIEKLKNEIKPNSGQIFSRCCDITDKESVQSAFKYIQEKFGQIDILINNAGITKPEQILTNGNEETLIKIVETNLFGVLFATKEAFNLMSKNNCAEGLIINVNSILGHKISYISGREPLYNIYPGSKFALRAMTEVVRHELHFLQNKRIRVASISPGLCKTEILDEFPNSEHIWKSAASLNPSDVSQGILYILSTPKHVEVHELIIKAVGDMA